MSELQPCPFCGGKAELVTGAPEYWVRCLTCGAGSDTTASSKRATDNWNRRPSQEPEHTTCPEGYSLVPTKITAESGHKYALMGAFSESITLTCPDCDTEEPNEHCEICNGLGEYEQSVAIEWNTIKRIHDRIVSASAPPGAPC